MATPRSIITAVAQRGREGRGVEFSWIYFDWTDGLFDWRIVQLFSLSVATCTAKMITPHWHQSEVGKVKERIYKVRVIRLISSFLEGVRFFKWDIRRS